MVYINYFQYFWKRKKGFDGLKWRVLTFDVLETDLAQKKVAGEKAQEK